jgi:hypothetical protein
MAIETSQVQLRWRRHHALCIVQARQVAGRRRPEHFSRRAASINAPASGKGFYWLDCPRVAGIFIFIYPWRSRCIASFRCWRYSPPLYPLLSWSRSGLPRQIDTACEVAIGAFRAIVSSPPARNAWLPLLARTHIAASIRAMPLRGDANNRSELSHSALPHGRSGQSRKPPDAKTCTVRHPALVRRNGSFQRIICSECASRCRHWWCCRWSPRCCHRSYGRSHRRRPPATSALASILLEERQLLASLDQRKVAPCVASVLPLSQRGVGRATAVRQRSRTATQ